MIEQILFVFIRHNSLKVLLKTSCYHMYHLLIVLIYVDLFNAFFKFALNKSFE